MGEVGLELPLRSAMMVDQKSTYDTSHGDFAFGRLIDIVDSNRAYQIPPGNRENNVRFVELDGFVR